MLRNTVLINAALALVLGCAASAQTAEELVARNLAARGGSERILAVRSARMVGTITMGPVRDTPMTLEWRRPSHVRLEFKAQGLTGIQAYDGSTAWALLPFHGMTAPEVLPDEQRQPLIDMADFDGPLVNYKEKGNKVELVGKEPVEGTDAWKLRVTLANGDVHNYFMDTDYFVPIKVEQKRVVRGAERETETSIGDYKEVAGVYFPHSFESGQKGSANRSKVVYDRIEANVPLDDSLFHRPAGPAK